MIPRHEFPRLRFWLSAALLATAGVPVAADIAGRVKPWTRQDAAHLLRRAGFGGTPEQIDRLAAMSRKQAVESLLNFDRIPDSAERPTIDRYEPPERRELRAMTDEQRQKIRMDRNRQDQANLHLMRRWWIDRMVTSPRPLQEKMVLFWHGHFTSGAREVRMPQALWNQNELFRRMAVGNFRTLLLEVSKDPAMLVYLNNAQNIKGRPNENYARELMELFTLGIGHYTETDIKEAARAFTGWSIDRETGEFLFRARQHDDGVKTVLGRRGKLNGGDVIDAILAQPRAAEYVAGRMWTFFAGTEPPPNVRKHLGNVFRKNEYEIKPLLLAIFTHDAFYSDRVMYAEVKSPVELLVGTLRTLEIKPTDLDAMVLALRMMGQELFQPPNVKGWDGGYDWLTSATLFNRYNAMARIISGTQDAAAARRRRMMSPAVDDLAMKNDGPLSSPQSPFDPMPLVRARKLASVEAVVDDFVARLIGRPLADERREVLIEALRSSLKSPADVGAAANADAIRELLMLIVATPEYQLN